MATDDFDLEDVSFFDIDEMRLDKEWVNQPRRYHKVAVALEEARGELDRRKAALDVESAEAQMDLRNNPNEYGLAKVTDKAVEAAYVTTKRYKKALEKLHEAKRKVGLLQAAVTTMEHRKRALEKLVDLRLADYFSEPRSRGGSKEMTDEYSQRAARDRRRKKEDDDE